MNHLQLAPFRFDVTPPLGHSLCGGWIQPARQVDDELEALGFVLLGAGDPIVICALDWLSLLNRAHQQWRHVLAEAARTTPDRIVIQCVHQHDAPMVCLDTHQLVEAEGDLPHIVRLDFYDKCLERGRRAVQQALSQTRAVTHVAHGQAKVDKVASNRRIARDDNGRVVAERRSFCRDAQLRNMPEGLVDPWLKTVAFYNESEKLTACHYYATHPQSYYGDGRISSEFVGLARKRRQAEDPNCIHVYFTGCAGNISAGKYNDGSSEAKHILLDRLYDGILQSEAILRPVPIGQVVWRTREILPRPCAVLARPALVEQLTNRYYPEVTRGRAAFMLSWLDRVQRGDSLLLSSLRINDISILHLPGECFVEYQLRAQKCWPAGFVATAAYGDGGPWYIPVKEEYDKGGYELTSTFCESEVDDLLSCAVQELLE